MIVKNYLAPTIREALSKAKRDLGSEAVILQTKKLTRGGFLGFFEKVCVQITAAVDRKDSFESCRPSATFLPPVINPTPPADTELEKLRKDLCEVKASVETLTKLLGTMFNVAVSTNKSLSRVNPGQNVPGALETNDAERLAEMIIKGDDL